jgi:uncharacterized protein
MKKIIFTLLFAISLHISAQQASKNTKAIELIKKTGATELFESAILQIGAMVPAEKKPEFLKEANTSLDKLYSDIAEVYNAEFTPQEIDELIVFYDSDLGKKLAKKQSALSQKAMLIGQNWGMGVSDLAKTYSE